MKVSAEIRWFWRSHPPDHLQHWFCTSSIHPYPAGGGQEARKDEYLRDSNQDELGLKHRGTKQGVEIKGLVAIAQNAVAAGPFAGPVEIWTKWTSESLELDSNMTVTTEKLRWLRKFDTTGQYPVEVPLGPDERPLDQGAWPVHGCNVELTRVMLPHQDLWWTLCFEAFGTIQTVEDSLQKAADTMAKRLQQEPVMGQRANYPTWLKEHAAGV